MSDQVTSIVQAQYGAVATSGLSSLHQGVKAVAEAFGYTAEELQSIPAEANMGLSCGNPTAMAGLREGETVVDLGCGGGLDVFLAARKVGSSGRVIGIDMTQQMIDLARQNAQRGAEPLPNVEFHLAEIAQMPMIADNSVDCVLSNCVINLVSDKQAAFSEIFRILKPGGRIAISDIALKKPLPEIIAQDLSAYVGCIAGAISLTEYQEQMLKAGFEGIQLIDAQADLNAYAQVENQSLCCSPGVESTPATENSCCAETPNSTGLNVLNEGCCSSAPVERDETLHLRLAELLKQHDINDYAASVKVFARKPLT